MRAKKKRTTTKRTAAARRSRLVTKKAIWKKADGTVVAVVDMDDAHLLNTIAFVERRVRAWRDQFGDNVNTAGVYPHAEMVGEARRRGLLPGAYKAAEVDFVTDGSGIGPDWKEI